LLADLRNFSIVHKVPPQKSAPPIGAPKSRYYSITPHQKFQWRDFSLQRMTAEQTRDTIDRLNQTGSTHCVEPVSFIFP
jgi:hypothetical protein